MLTRQILYSRGLLNGVCGPASHGPCSVAAILNSSFKYTSMKFPPGTLKSSFVCSSIPYQQNCRLYTTESLTTPFGDFGTTDLLLKELQSASTSDKILEIVSKHHVVMNNQHILKALTALFNIEKSRGLPLSSSSLISQNDFCVLCSLLQKRACFLDSNDIVTSVKCLIYLGVQSSTTVMQMLLQMIRKYINEYNLNEICFIGFLLLKMKDCPLVDALKIALPVLFETHLNMQMNKDDLRHLISLLHFADSYKVHKYALTKILRAILSYPGAVDSKTAVRMLNYCFDIGLCEITLQLYDKALNALVDSIEDVSSKQLNWIINKMFRQYLEHKRCNQLYHENFFCEVAETVMRRKLSLVHALPFVKNMITMGYLNSNILDYIATRIVEKEEDITQAKHLGIYTLDTFSIANYKPANIDDIVNMVLKEEEIHKENQNFQWLILAQSLAFFGHYPEKILALVFSEQFLKENFQANDFFLRKNYSIMVDLYQTVISEKPEYPGPFPPEDLLQKAIKMRMERKGQSSFPIQDALEKGSGGVAYVKTNLWTKYGIFIDHMVVMRKGVCPVAINQKSSQAEEEVEKTFVEDISVPHKSQRVLILVLPRPHFMNNVDKLRGSLAFKIQCLEGQGYSVVVIALHRWQELAEHEKIPYLMQKIREECENVENGMSSWGKV